MSIVLDGTTGLAGAATGALNGALGATTPSTVVATTINASGVATFSAGSVSAPALTTSGDTNTGIFFPAADTVATTTGGTERTRIASTGRQYFFNAGSATTVADCIFNFAGTFAGNRGISINATDSATNMDAIWFATQGTQRGVISCSSGGTAYNSVSDYRLKEDVAPMTGALSKVALLKPVTYTWKSDKVAGQGFSAHELAAVGSEAVTGTKDEVDSEGNPVYQGIDTSFLVATLTAAIQELNAKFEEYKASHP